MMLNLSKVRSGRSADFLPPSPPCEKGRGGTGPQRSKLSGAFSRNRIFIVFRGRLRVNFCSEKPPPRASKFTQKSRRRGRANLEKLGGVLMADIAILLSVVLKVVCCAPKCTPLEQIARAAPKLRDGETTIKIKFSHLRGGGPRGQRGKSSKNAIFMGNATTIKF